MSFWSHSLLGKYDIESKNIAIDWGRLFLDPVGAEGVWVHELSHGVLAELDFGQATNNFLNLSGKFSKLSPADLGQMSAQLFGSQNDVQEALATFLQLHKMRDTLGPRDIFEWAKDRLPDEYYQRVINIHFLFLLGSRYRDLCTDKLARLSMETGIRKNAPRKDILKSPEVLKEYLNYDSNSPNKRYAKIVEKFRYYPWLCTKSMEEIAKISEIEYHGPPTKKEVADFANYLLEKTPSTERLSEKDIGDTPTGSDAFMQVAKRVTLANLHLNLKDGAEFLFQYDDLKHYSDVTEAVLMMPFDSSDPIATQLFSRTKDNPEASLVLFRTSGEKYTSVISKVRAREYVSGYVGHATIIAKGGTYNFHDKELFVNGIKPHIVVYNNVDSLFNEIKMMKGRKFRSRYLGATQGHPFYVVIVKVLDDTPLLVTTTFGAGQASAISSYLGVDSGVFDEKDLIFHKKDLNNLFAIWMGMPWQVDWVQSMTAKKVYLRDGTLYS